MEKPFIKLDFDSGIVHVDDEVITNLSAQEFMLLSVLLTEFPNSDEKLTESLMKYRSQQQSSIHDFSSGIWLEKFFESDRFKSNDSSYEIEVMRKVRSSLRKTLLECYSIKPYVYEIVSKNKCVVAYPKSRISADIVELQSHFK